MANKKFGLGMLVLVLVFGMMVVGCDDGSGEGGAGSSGGGGTMLEFRVRNYYEVDKTLRITNIAILNGSTTNSPVLRTETLNLSYGEVSSVYKVSGFTEKASAPYDNQYVFSVRLTYGDGRTAFVSGRAWSKKIQVYNWNYTTMISFESGNW